MLASTSARVLSWYYRTRATLDAPVGFQLDAVRELWEITPTTRRRETLLVVQVTLEAAALGGRAPSTNDTVLVEGARYRVIAWEEAASGTLLRCVGRR